MKNFNFVRYALGSCVAAALLADCGGSQPPIGAPVVPSIVDDALPFSKTFHYTGSAQSFRVPRSVTKLQVVARGAAGAGAPSEEYFGRGGRVYAIIPVRPRETLYVFVGGQGSKTGGFNGGGNPGRSPHFNYGYGGGGASDVREGGRELATASWSQPGAEDKGVATIRAPAVTAVLTSVKRAQALPTALMAAGEAPKAKGEPAGPVTRPAKMVLLGCWVTAAAAVTKAAMAGATAPIIGVWVGPAVAVAVVTTAAAVAVAASTATLVDYRVPAVEAAHPMSGQCHQSTPLARLEKRERRWPHRF